MTVLRKYWEKFKWGPGWTIVANLLKYIIYLLMFTCRVEIVGLERFRSVTKEFPTIIMYWHGSLPVYPFFLWWHTYDVPLRPVLSKSRDGEILNVFINSYKNAEAIRVPHDAKQQALKEVIRVLKDNGTVIFTPDGPRGPIHEVKQGLVFSAAISKAKILPWAWSASRYWELSTWDKMRIPKPFSKVRIHVGEELSVVRSKDDDWIEQEAKRLGNELCKLEDSIRF